MARNAARFPQTAWPRQLDAGLAAAYCGERTTVTFWRKVRSGEYPPPTSRRKGSRAFWHINQLDKWIDHRHGVTGPNRSIAELV